MSDDLNTKFLKVTGLTWNLEEAIANMKSAGIPDSDIAKKILWLIPDGSMLDSNGRTQAMTKELLSDDVLSGIGIKESDKIKSSGSEEITYEYVDLGLPSGTLWAKHNIQDTNGNELYFAWGETQGYIAEQVGTDKYFAGDESHADYKFGPFDFDKTNCGITKYNETDGKTELDAEDDAATVNWGSNWRMPTKEQFNELIANTEYEWAEIDDVQGAKFTSTVEGYTDKFLFFPAVGDTGHGVVTGVGRYGSCWSVSSASVICAWGLYFGDGEYGVNEPCRAYGRSIRPVRVK